MPVNVKKKIREHGLRKYKTDPLTLPLKELKEKNPRLFKVLSASDSVRVKGSDRVYFISRLRGDIKELKKEDAKTKREFALTPERVKGIRRSSTDYHAFFRRPSYKPVFDAYRKKRKTGMDMYKAALEAMKESNIEMVRITRGKQFLEISTSMLTPEKFKKLVERKTIPSKKTIEKILS